MTPETIDAPSSAAVAAPQSPPLKIDVSPEDFALIVTRPNTAALTKSAEDFLSMVRNFNGKLETAEQREEASYLKGQGAELRKKLTAEHKKRKDVVNRLKDAVLEAEKKDLELPLELEALCNRLCVEWDERMREIARKLEEDARRAREKAAEEERMRQASAVRESLVNEGAPIAEAEKAAMDVVSQPLAVAHVPVAPEIRRASGEIEKTYWHHEVVDPSLVPRQFCDPSSKKLQAHVEAYQKEANVLGVRFWSEKKLEHRKARSK